MRRAVVISAIAVAALGAAGYGLYQFGMQRGMEMAAPSGSDHAQHAAPRPHCKAVRKVKKPRAGISPPD